MDETSTTAMLVGTREMFASQPDGLSVTVPRDEIEEALRSDPPSELTLDILRKVEGASELERRTVTVAWKRPDLESVVENVDVEAITFSFDPAELERLLSEPDVEGHGLREAAVVLSIAAAAAVGGAASASAATHDEATSGERGIAVVAAATHDEATSSERGIAFTAAATHDEATSGERGIAAIAPATHDEATLASRGIESTGTVAATHDEATLASRGIEATTPAATHDEATLTARGIEATTPVEATASSGSRFDLPSLDPALAASLAAALGAFGLAILGASFMSRRRDPGTV